jgi:hypothetical protein
MAQAKVKWLRSPAYRAAWVVPSGSMARRWWVSYVGSL